MGLLDFFGKQKGASDTFFLIDSRLHPIRLLSHRNDSADLEITVTNTFDKELLTSLVIRAPKTLGFDQTALSQQKEIRLGPLPPNKTVFLKIPVFSTQRTTPGSYPLSIHAVSHYRDYGFVLNEVRKNMELRVV